MGYSGALQARRNTAQYEPMAQPKHNKDGGTRPTNHIRLSYHVLGQIRCQMDPKSGQWAYQE